MRAIPKGVFAGALITLLLTGCLVRALGGGPEHRLTGTCDGACEYYLDCKDADAPEARARCVTECGEVFVSASTIRDFESLSCQDAVEFVDGIPATAAR